MPMVHAADGNVYEESELARLHSHHGGQAASLEAAVAEFSRLSGSCYSNRQDAAASFWREAADLLRARAVACRQTQSKFVPVKEPKT